MRQHRRQQQILFERDCTVLCRPLRVVATLVALLAACETPTTPPLNPIDDTPDSNTTRVEWLKDNVLFMRSVDPSDQEWTDLEFLKDEIGDARLVMLGEQSHGDGTTFLAKTRLIKYFHQEMGFDVLAFESGLYDVRKAWQLMEQGEDAHTAVRRSVFDIWTGSEQFQPLIDYLGEAAEATSPLEISGFDVQFTGTASAEFFVSDLESFLESIGSTALRDTAWPQARDLLQDLIEYLWLRYKPTSQERMLLYDMLRRVRQEADDRLSDTGDGEAAFWSQMLSSTMVQSSQDWLYDPDGPFQWELGNARDRQMGENLLWLARTHYPDRKILVWAATYHEVRNIEDIEVPSQSGFYNAAMTMGNVVWEALGSELYVLGFSAYVGWKGSWWNTPTAVGPAPHSSLEWLLNEASVENAIVDLRSIPPGGEWLRRRLTAWPMGYVRMVADWTQHMDGICFTHTMEPSTEATR